MNEGWIKLHRQIMTHWIYENAEYYKAWTTILMMVNHEGNEILIDKEVYACDRGQSLLSLNHWAKIFGKSWTIQKVRTFLSLLKKSGMINTDGLHKTTRLTVLIYDFYQGLQQANNRQITGKQQRSNRETTTNKNDKNDIDKSISYTTISDFYRKQIEVADKYLEKKSEDPQVRMDVENYKQFISFLYDWPHRNSKDSMGTSLHAPMVNVLGIQKQLKFVDFVKHYAKAKKLNIDFYSKIRAMENKPDIQKKCSDFNLTLYNWIKIFDK